MGRFFCLSPVLVLIARPSVVPALFLFFSFCSLAWLPFLDLPYLLATSLFRTPLRCLALAQSKRTSWASGKGAAKESYARLCLQKNKMILAQRRSWPSSASIALLATSSSSFAVLLVIFSSLAALASHLTVSPVRLSPCPYSPDFCHSYLLQHCCLVTWSGMTLFHKVPTRHLALSSLLICGVGVPCSIHTCWALAPRDCDL